MKKQTLVIVLLAVFALSCLALAGCHECQFGQWTTVVEPTCTQVGQEQRVCKCGEVETRNIPATGHTEGDWITDVEPGCATSGSNHQVCAVCGAILQISSVDATGHSFGEWSTVRESTCTEAGKEERICACGVVETRDLPLAKHIYGDWTEAKPATCTEDGLELRVCQCSAAETRIIEATGHSHEAVVTNPTCLEQGYTTHTCHCGDSFVDTYVDALGHTEDSVVVENNVEPDCVNNGSYDNVVYCTACKSELSRDTVTVDALGHDEVQHDAQAPTCTAIGWSEYVACSRCDYSTHVEIPATGHTEGKWIVDVEPGCTTAGSKHQVCAICGATLKTQSIGATGHSFGNWTVVEESTCLEAGQQERVCSCGEKETAIIPTSHSYVSWTVTRQPTCTEDGVATGFCACGEQSTKAVPKLGHNYNSVITEPTCLEQGYTTHTCASCGDIYKDAYVEALGHDEIPHDAQLVSCTEIGWDAYITCSRCDYSTYNVIPATGHTDGEWIIDVESDCEGSGSKHQVCATCGTTINTATIEAKGHSFSDWLVTKEATCTEYGQEERACECGEVEIKKIQPKNHQTTYHSSKSATCTEKGWYSYETCSRCDYSTYEEIPAKGHIEGEWIVDVVPSGATAGSKHQICSACGVTINTATVGTTIKNIDLVEIGGKCYLTIEVQLEGVDNAYLYLYEGNSQYELKGTQVSGTTGSTETLMFDLNKLATAEDGRFAGGWMDIFINTTIDGKDYTSEICIDHSNPLAQPGKMVCDKDYCYRFITYLQNNGRESLKVYFNQNKVTYTMNVEDVDGQPVLTMDGNVNLNHLTLDEGETFTGGTINMTVDSKVVKGEVDATGAFHATLALSALKDGFNSTFSTVKVKMGDKVVYNASTLDLIGCSTIFDYDPEGGSPRLYANKFMSANGYQYIYGVDWNEPYLRVIDVGHEIKFTDVTLKLDNDTPYMVLSGTYGSAHTLETLQTAADGMFVGESGLSLQQYPKWPYRWYGQQDGVNNYTIKAENGAFEIWCDLSKGEGWANGDIIYGHLCGSDMRTPFTPATIAWNGLEFTIGAPNYDCASWMGGLAIIYVNQPGAPVLKISGAHLEKIGERACYIVTGTYANMTADQLNALTVDLESGGVDFAAGLCSVNFDAAAGTYEVVVDVTNFDADGSLLYPHIYNGDSRVEVRGGTDGESITVGGKVYTISINWDMPALIVSRAY